MDAGAIDQRRARKTAQERELLQRAYGEDWREQVTGDGQSFRGMREMIAQQEAAVGQVDPELMAAYEQAMQRRQEAVDRARAQLKRPRRRQAVAARALQRGQGIGGGVEAR